MKLIQLEVIQINLDQLKRINCSDSYQSDSVKQIQLK